MFKKILVIVAVLGLALNSAFAGDPEVSLTGYVEGYYGVTNTQYHPDDDAWQDSRAFNLNSMQRNQFGLNWAQLNAGISADWYRGKLSMQMGEVPSAYFPMNGMLNEAYAGFKVIDNLWIDAGVFLTHIGGELFLAQDNWLSTYSMLTYVGPFYYSGAKASYEVGKFNLMLGVVNGNILQTGNNNDSKTFIFYE